MTTRIVALVLLTGAVAFAQLDTNSITVTSSSPLSVHPDQIVFAVSVGSGTSTTLAGVLTALQPVGISAANFASVNSYSGLVITGAPGVSPGPAIQWSFILPVAFANMKTTVAALSALQQSITQNNSGLTLSFNVQGTQVSTQLQQMQVCPYPDLFADALAQAQKLAAAAGLSAGNVLALSSATQNVGNDASTVALLGSLSFSAYIAPSLCTMTVKFALTR